ncbi:hypothetical protein [Dyadobacter sp. BHUBP1]|uniref:hypothetical protein n=1 Tax=Dyadobacter sp. BHUBP1 TaxID=3424178 RepID=UPI003D351A12
MTGSDPTWSLYTVYSFKRERKLNWKAPLEATISERLAGDATASTFSPVALKVKADDSV